MIAHQQTVIVFTVFMVDAVDVAPDPVVHLVEQHAFRVFRRADRKSQQRVFRALPVGVDPPVVRLGAGVDLGQMKRFFSEFFQLFSGPSDGTVIKPAVSVVVGSYVAASGMQGDAVNERPGSRIGEALQEKRVRSGKSERDELNVITAFRQFFPDRFQPGNIDLCPGDFFFSGFIHVPFVAEFPDGILPFFKCRDHLFQFRFISGGRVRFGRADIVVGK